MALNAAGHVGPLDGMFIPVAGVSLYSTVTASSQQLTLVASTTYILTSSTDCFIKQGANPTASAAATSMYVPRGLPVLIQASQGAKLAVIRIDTDGHVTLQKVAVAY